jgi:hypothetical protein
MALQIGDDLRGAEIDLAAPDPHASMAAGIWPAHGHFHPGARDAYHHKLPSPVR